MSVTRRQGRVHGQRHVGVERGQGRRHRRRQARFDRRHHRHPRQPQLGCARDELRGRQVAPARTGRGSTQGGVLDPAFFFAGRACAAARSRTARPCRVPRCAPSRGRRAARRSAAPAPARARARRGRACASSPPARTARRSVRQRLRRDADCRCPRPRARRRVAVASRAHRDRAARRRELRGVRQQVPEHLPQPIRIAGDDQPVAELDPQVLLLRRRRRPRWFRPPRQTTAARSQRLQVQPHLAGDDP